jgi:hypothetical protein
MPVHKTPMPAFPKNTAAAATYGLTVAELILTSCYYLLIPL